MTEGSGRSPAEAGEKPPIGGSWRNLYAAVLLNLALVVFLLWVLTRAFR